MSMFCYQCQEAAKGTGCTGSKGVCGVSSEVIHLQDALVFSLKGLAYYTSLLGGKGFQDQEVNRFFSSALFSTITNVNFSEDDFLVFLRQSLELKKRMSALAEKEELQPNHAIHPSCTWNPTTDQEMRNFAASIDGHIDAPNEDIRSLRALVLYGLKGLAAYTEHASKLGYEDPEIYSFMHKALVSLFDDQLGVDGNIALVMETGQFGVSAMALLDQANTSSYGNPEVTRVNIGVGQKPGILISGHDLKDMEELLAQTEGTGVDVYTHSEMLPAHYYPAFKKYTHFVGNYGNAWWKQKEEFESFRGPILFTTNCIVPPNADSGYAQRAYTTGVAGYPGFTHIADGKNGQQKDFSPIIAEALSCQPPVEIETGEIIGGFAHAQVLALADKVVDAVKSGAIRKFVVMAGCDGRMKSREYYSEFAAELPTDTVILTAGCAKYRYNKLQLGDIGGIPRVLDAGQCNDSYSLAVIALKLKEVFQLNDINDLPIVYNVAWYEQKAVIVLLALLYLGVKNIHLGPTLPAFLSPNVASVLVEKFGIGGISNAPMDVKEFLKMPA